MHAQDRRAHPRDDKRRHHGGRQSVVSAIDRYAAELGLAFWIDDIPTWKAAAGLGKSGEDAARRAPYPALFGSTSHATWPRTALNAPRAPRTLAWRESRELSRWVLTRRN
jgi:hypothetical protein